MGKYGPTKTEALVLATILALLFGLKTCYHPHPDPVLTTRPLKENERAVITLDRKSGRLEQTVVGPHSRVANVPNSRAARPTDEKAVVDLHESRKVSFSVASDGQVTVLTQKAGLIHEPGIVASYSDRARLGLDVQVAYYRRWGVSCGALSTFGRSSPPSLSFYLAGTYNFYSNTSLFVGLNQRKDLEIGIRVAL